MARIYDYLLGGKDHYPADRAEARHLLALYPPLAAMARENRAFLDRAITWAARQGISQFLDLGAGLPTERNTHQIARDVNPAAAVAYVDTDPVVLAHARALLATDGVTAVDADLCHPPEVLAALRDGPRLVGLAMVAIQQASACYCLAATDVADLNQALRRDQSACGYAPPIGLAAQRLGSNR